jgi:glycerophosphoryl diester phosphodiesterase
MRHRVPAALAVIVVAGATVSGHGSNHDQSRVQLGPRPFFLVDDMKESPLKRKLERCADGPFQPTTFSIGRAANARR